MLAGTPLAPGRIWRSFVMEIEMQELSMDEIEQVSGADLVGDMAMGALAGGFAGLYVSGGNPVAFLCGAAGGAAIAGLIYYLT